MADLEARGGDEGRAWAMVDRMGGNIGGALVGGVVATILLGPVVGPVVGPYLGAVATPAIEELSRKLGIAMGRKVEKAERVTVFAADFAGIDVSELLQRSLDDDNRMLLMTMTLEAAAEAADGRKIGALARAYARGILSSDSAKVDEQKRIVRTLAALDPIDVRVLECMTHDQEWLIRPNTSSPHTPSLILEVPGAAAVMESVVAQLSMLGLIHNATEGGLNWSGVMPWHVTEFGAQCIDALREIGESEPGE